MILLCPQCHRSYIHADEEIAQRGGLSAFRCLECSSPLQSMEAAMGVSLTHQDFTARAEDDPTATQQRGALDRESTDLEIQLNPDATVADVSNPALDLLQPRGQMVIGQGFVTGAMDAPPHLLQHSGDSTRPVHAMRGDATRQVQAPSPARPPEGERRGGLGVALGCSGLLAALLLLGAVAAGAWLFVIDDGDAQSPPDANASPDQPDDAPAPPARASIQDRLRLAIQSNSSAAVPALALPSDPAQHGEPVLLTTSGLILGEQMVASINNNQIEASARPSPTSPFIQPLAVALDASFEGLQRDPDADTDRWAVFLIDGKVEYQPLFEALFTAWERGANLQIAATNPQNPHAWLAVEVFPARWPDMDSVDIPAQFTHRDPARRPDLTVKPAIIHIRDDGFTLRAHDQKPDQAEHIQRDTTWPIRELRKRYEALRQEKPDLNAIQIDAHPRTRAFTLLQTISALLPPVEGLAEIKQLQLGPPNMDKALP
jgi:hypothetical protein